MDRLSWLLSVGELVGIDLSQWSRSTGKFTERLMRSLFRNARAIVTARLLWINDKGHCENRVIICRATAAIFFNALGIITLWLVYVTNLWNCSKRYNYKKNLSNNMKLDVNRYFTLILMTWKINRHFKD